MPWVCETCGHRHGGNDPPCEQCDHGALAQVRRERVPETVTPSTLFVWRCLTCGHAHGRRESRCAECDQLGLAAAYVDDGGVLNEVERSVTGDEDDEQSWSGVADAFDVAVDSTLWLVAFGLGLFTVLAGFLFLIGGSPRFGGPLLVGGLFALPSLRDKVGVVIGTRPPGWLAAIAYAFGVVGAVFWYNV